MIRTFLYLGVFLIFFIQSCTTDIDLNAEKEDVTVVYGFLDPSNDTQYIKINRTYLVDGDVNKAASTKNITNYNPSDIQVFLEEYNEKEQLIKTIKPTRTTNEISKDSGIFDNSSNILYRFTDKINHRRTYKLIIDNKVSGKLISSKIKTIGELLTETVGGQKIGLVDITGRFTNKTIRLSTKPANTGRIDGKFIFNFSEIYNRNGIKDTVRKSLEFPLGTVKINDLDLQFILRGASVIKELESKLGNTLPPDLEIRIFGEADFYFYSAGEELDIYMTLDEPGNRGFSLTQYTNIENGLGIFSSRNTTYWSPENRTVASVDYLSQTITYLENRFKFKRTK